MKTPVLLTYKILKEKACNIDIDESWAAWAIEMIKGGYEIDSLYQLAGISKPFNQFELQDLTSKVLRELNLDFSNKQETIRNYAYYLIKTSIENPNKYYDVLREFRDIYYQLEMENDYQDFALLFWAKDDLISEGVQFYWDGADSKNIDHIIREQFKVWLAKFEAEK